MRFSRACTEKIANTGRLAKTSGTRSFALSALLQREPQVRVVPIKGCYKAPKKQRFWGEEESPHGDALRKQSELKRQIPTM